MMIVFFMVIVLMLWGYISVYVGMDLLKMGKIVKVSFYISEIWFFDNMVRSKYSEICFIFDFMRNVKSY